MRRAPWWTKVLPFFFLVCCCTSEVKTALQVQAVHDITDDIQTENKSKDVITTKAAENRHEERAPSTVVDDIKLTVPATPTSPGRIYERHRVRTDGKVTVDVKSNEATKATEDKTAKVDEKKGDKAKLYKVQTGDTKTDVGFGWKFYLWAFGIGALVLLLGGAGIRALIKRYAP